MSARLQQLEEILEIVTKDPANVSKQKRIEFWKLVREIKREPYPNDSEVQLAATIRDIFFEENRGRTYSLAPALVIEGFLGLLGLWGYLWVLGFHLEWISILTWSQSDWTVFGIRFLFVFVVIAFLYPFGRFIAGKWAGIKILGMCRDQYYEPTLKIDYVTFLKASPSKRKWFFFFAGTWTIITALLLGVVGLLFDLDLTAFIPVILLIIFEGHVIQSGSPKASGGEMGHYNREKRIESEWKKNITDS